MRNPRRLGVKTSFILDFSNNVRLQNEPASCFTRHRKRKRKNLFQLDFNSAIVLNRSILILLVDWGTEKISLLGSRRRRIPRSNKVIENPPAVPQPLLPRRECLLQLKNKATEWFLPKFPPYQSSRAQELKWREALFVSIYVFQLDFNSTKVLRRSVLIFLVYRGKGTFVAWNEAQKNPPLR